MAKFAFALALGAAVLLGIATEAPAQTAEDRCKDEQDAAAEGKNYKTIIGPDGRKIFVIQRAFVVCGKVPKPQVIYVLQQRNINYEWENLKQDFLPKILESVKRDPF